MNPSSPLYQKAFRRYLRTGLSIEIQMKTAAESGRYVWVTQGDDKVRSEHAANEGQIFSWNDPPGTGNPGDDYHCRCTAEPYDDAEEERPLYPDAIDPVYPELLLPLSRFGRLLAGLLRAVDDIHAETLTGEQVKNLGRFDGKLPKDAGPIRITGGKNGQRTFSADVPARNIPGSFARYEKTVDRAGKTISYTKTTYASDGSIVHTKVK